MAINGNGNGNGTGTLAGRVVLVTGAARGIGRAIALEMARRGAAVAVNYRASQSAAEALVAEIAAIGAQCLPIQGDVADREEARRVVKEAIDQWGRLDVLVNNAGITRDKSLRKVADDEWADVISVNLNGTYYCTSAALPHMMRQEFGRIINITSFSGQPGNFGQANYAAGKGGIVAFTRTVALEMAKYNITANCIAPGFTSTEMLTTIPDQIMDQIKARIPLGRLAEPSEIAHAAGFLAAEADYMTGQQLSINGGLNMA